MIITEMEIEEHPFAPFVPDNATTLIIGSFPVMEQVKKKNNTEEWYYGSTNNLFWRLLSEVFKTELTTTQQKKNLFEKHGIAITDIFKKIRRKKESDLDKYIEVVEYKTAIDSLLSKSRINRLLFTSKYVESHFLKIYPHTTSGICLPSPSRAANIPISKSEEFKKYKLVNPDGNTYSFRVYKYKQLLA